MPLEALPEKLMEDITTTVPTQESDNKDSSEKTLREVPDEEPVEEKKEE